ncbi:MAG: glycosyltransferase family 39 protein [Candidatus Omnitrophota bacterium]
MRKIKQENTLYELLLQNNNAVAVGIFLSAFFIRLGAILFLDNFQGPEPMLNLITSLHVFYDPSLSGNINFLHLPFYLYSLALAVSLGAEQLVVARFMSLLFGCLSVVFFYYLVRLLFDNKRALLSAVFLCCFPTHIIKSIITVPDVIGLCLIAGGLCFALEKKIIFSAGLCGLACGYYYLAWICFPVISVFILLRKNLAKSINIKDFLLFLAITVVVPLLWLLLLRGEYGNDFLFLHNLFTEKSVLKYIYAFMINARKISCLITENLTILGVGLGVIGMGFNILKRKHYESVLFLGMIFLCLCIGMFHPDIPILKPGAFFLSMFMIPFVIEGAICLVDRVRIKSKGLRSLLFICLLLVIFLQGAQTKTMIPKEIKQASKWLKENVSQNDIIFIEKDDVGYYSTVIMLSGLPQGNFYHLDRDHHITPAHYGFDECAYLVVFDNLNFWKVKGAVNRGMSFGMCVIFEVNK